MALQLIKDTAISYTVQVALDAVKSCLQIGGVELFRGAQNHLVKIEDSLVDINDFIVIAERSPKMDRKLMKLLEKLKDAAYDAQDLLEEYEIADRRRNEEAANSMLVRDTMTNKVGRKEGTKVVAIKKKAAARLLAYESRDLIRFFAESGALILLDANDTALSLTSIYEEVAKDKNRCSWESFEVYRHLKSLGYIINRHGLSWTLKINKSCCNSKCLEGTLESDDTSKPNREDETSSIICQLKDMRINEMMPNYDVYLPNSKFRKSAPGNPSFILYLLSDDPPSKADIQVLEAECKGIPLKFCHLEHGRVSFFSFDEVELPFLP